MQTNRRNFIASAASFVAALGWEGCASPPCDGETLPPWKPGLLDLHFIYTGCGENMFYRLPDGTAILNDVGEFYRPKYLPSVPLLPSPDRLGGDWVRRYLHRVYPEKTIDYAVFSHWHEDHVGHAAFGRPDSPDGAYRFRIAKDGTKANGFTCVAEDFKVKRLLDHQYPRRGHYSTQDSSMELLESWLEKQGGDAPLCEQFHVGALDQIKLCHDPDRYRGVFSIRNICADGVVWDGRDGAVDILGPQEQRFDRKIPQNLLSCGFLIRYGAFSYFSGGDLQSDNVLCEDGRKVPFDSFIGRAVGPVSLCKMTHHGCSNAMSREFLEAVKADAYVACMWSPAQCSPEALDRIASVAPKSGGRALILPQVMVAQQRKWFVEHGYAISDAPAVHVVVRVELGGSSYSVYLVDASDESQHVVAKFDKKWIGWGTDPAKRAFYRAFRDFNPLNDIGIG